MALSFFAVCPRGLEIALSAELQDLGAVAPKAAGGGVAFQGELATAYAANLHSRFASRVLWRVGGGGYRGEDDLYRLANEIAWERHFDSHRTLRVDVTATRSPLRSLQFATLRIKDAVVDRLRDRTGTRPSIERASPQVRVYAHLQAAVFDLFLDLSGESLFKRGWRADKGEAPLKENLAAGLLWLSGWTPAQPLLDPFCGSGTIAIEAACIASGRAPGLERHFAFEQLANFDAAAWRRLLDAALAAVDDERPWRIVGRDISTRVVELAATNAQRAGLAEALADGRLAFEAGDARQGEAPAAAGMVLCNPPYGEQSNPKSASVAGLMGDYGNQLKRAFAGWDVWMLTSDRQLPRQLRLQETRKVVLFNGPLECRLFRFEIVAGSYRRAPDAAAPVPS